MESLSFVAPVAYTLDWLILFSDKSKVLTLGIVTTLGVIVGSALVALATRSFRWEGFGGVEDTANHLVGAVLMGVGGVTAMGCTVGQGLSGVSTLALGSFIALGGIVGGAVLACAGRSGGWSAACDRRRGRRRRRPERRFGGLRRLYGDGAMPACAAPGWPWSAWAAWALGRGGAGAQRRGRLVLIDLDHVAESNINRQVQALGPRWARPRARRCASASPRSTPAARCMVVDDFVQPDNWPALLPLPVDALIDACDQVRAKQALAGWALRERVPLVCVGAAGGKRSPKRWRSTTWPTPRTTRCWPACGSACARPGAPRRAHGRALRVLARARAPARPAATCASHGAPLACHGYGSSVTVTATFGMVAAGEAIEQCLRRGTWRRKILAIMRGSADGVVSSVGRAADF
jgi:tRNA A37 threonylcarbamoyladenosine dehydratase